MAIKLVLKTHDQWHNTLIIQDLEMSEPIIELRIDSQEALQLESKFRFVEKNESNAERFLASSGGDIIELDFMYHENGEYKAVHLAGRLLVFPNDPFEYVGTGSHQVELQMIYFNVEDCIEVELDIIDEPLAWAKKRMSGGNE